MTESWKSNERHYCKICNCWMDGKPRAIRTHEEGKGHQEAYLAHQKAVRDAKAAAIKTQSADEAMWAKLDAAAQKSYEQHDLKGLPSSTYTPSAPSVASVATHPHSHSSTSRPSHSIGHGPPPKSLPLPPKPKEVVSPWQATVDPTSGATYYYNIHTLETTWTEPDELKKASAKSEKKVSTKRSHDDDKEETKETETKKQKTSHDTTTPSTEHTSAPAAFEIDEDTGFGKWTTVESEPEPEPEPEPVASASSRPHHTNSSSTAPAAATTDSTAPSIPSRYANLAGDDADEAEEDEPHIDLTQQLRNQFGPSALVQAKKDTYQPGTNLLEEEDPNANAPIAISFKKKSNRGGNQRKPIAASNH